jgi:DmsE family decaheme c-type cytochrome
LALALALLPVRAHRTAADDAPPTAAEDAPPASPEAPARYVGSEMCVACHQETAEAYAKTAHGAELDDSARLPEQRGCEACHGPGAAHAEAGGGKGVGGLRTFAVSRPAAERSAVCLSCHAGDPALDGFRGSEHAALGVACTDCHSGHAATLAPMLRAAPPQLCYGCHVEVRTSFALPERHKVDEGVVGCLDCHRAHGSRNVAALRAADNRTCFRCHGEHEGPFVFEHAAVLAEGCGRCHVPHGGTDRHLLKTQQVAQLCYECHTVTPADHIQPSFRQCTNCHVSIHGSNVDPLFLQQ